MPPQSHEMRTAKHIVDALASQYTVLRERVPMELCAQVDVSAPRLWASSRQVIDVAVLTVWRTQSERNVEQKADSPVHRTWSEACIE